MPVFLTELCSSSMLRFSPALFSIKVWICGSSVCCDDPRRSTQSGGIEMGFNQGTTSESTRNISYHKRKGGKIS